MEWIGLPVGTWLVFGIILMPVYGMVLAWFLGKPRNLVMSLRGVGYLVTMIVLLWGGLTVLSLLIRLFFFSSPGLHLPPG